MSNADQAELSALRIILSNLVARHVTTAGPHGGPEVREMLTKMRDECRLAAERAPNEAGVDLRNEALRSIDQFFKGITIT
jgi:hypothetical protein